MNFACQLLCLLVHLSHRYQKYKIVTKLFNLLIYFFSFHINLIFLPYFIHLSYFHGFLPLPCICTSQLSDSWSVSFLSITLGLGFLLFWRHFLLSRSINYVLAPFSLSWIHQNFGAIFLSPDHPIWRRYIMDPLQWYKLCACPSYSSLTA